MTIVEAAKTGKRMRRSGWADFIDPQYYELARQDILASDWEVEPDAPRYELAECKEILNKGIDCGATYTVSLLKSVLYYLEFVNEYSLRSRINEQMPMSSRIPGGKL
jgi:hypothetical protein